MEGYNKLATLMGDGHTDGHFLIFQKFESISAQNLLYLQAEIINLKETLDKITEIDSEDPEKRVFTQDWEALSSSPDSVQWEKWLELRRKLKEYCKRIFPKSANDKLTKKNRQSNCIPPDDHRSASTQRIRSQIPPKMARTS
jgi:hypothetical protein